MGLDSRNPETEKIRLFDVVHNVQPTVLIGCPANARTFSGPIVRAMAECNKRAVIFLLSNPNLAGGSDRCGYRGLD